MAVAAPGQLNLDEFPSWGSHGIDCFEKLEQIGEATYGLGSARAVNRRYISDCVPPRIRMQASAGFVSASYEQALMDACKQIEREMERFKDPREKAKAETRDWLNSV
ncbi:hypothetical protein ZWY2020_025324 [Hordeum vulgare]|nr:hypothetical protein ZWY2020_025324 [Hordeum vulgare]